MTNSKILPNTHEVQSASHRVRGTRAVLAEDLAQSQETPSAPQISPRITTSQATPAASAVRATAALAASLA